MISVRQFGCVLFGNLAVFYSAIWLYFIRRFGCVLFGNLAIFCSAIWLYFIRQFGCIPFGNLAVFCSAIWLYFIRRCQHIEERIELPSLIGSGSKLAAPAPILNSQFPCSHILRLFGRYVKILRSKTDAVPFSRPSTQAPTPQLHSSIAHAPPFFRPPSGARAKEERSYGVAKASRGRPGPKC